MFRESQEIGQYKLIRKLGQGGFGEVWLAERKSKFVTTKVAVKLPLDEQVDHEAIKHEATLWEQASGHPNILPIIDADEYDGQIVIVSEYAPDGSLEEWLKTNGAMSVERAIETTIQILDGLEFLHSRSIIHRDLKPANILLQGKTPRLADFGISRALRTTVASQSQNISGTFAYMSPEALDGKRSIQTDVWSVGVNLYQFLTGTLPFPQKEPSVLFPAIIMREFVPLPDSIPQNLKNVVAKALAKLPENRYKTATEMREDLQRILRVKSFTPLNGEGHPDLKQNLSIQYDNNYVEEIKGKQEKISSKVLETETSVRPMPNELLIDLHKSEIYSDISHPSVYKHSPEIRGLKLGMSLEEIESCFEVKITRQPDKLGCQVVILNFRFDSPETPYCWIKTFNYEKIPTLKNKITIGRYVGYKTIHFKFLDEYICEIFFELDSTYKWGKTDDFCQKVSKQLNLSTSWMNSFGNSKCISTQFFDIFALVFRQQATLKFVSLEQQKEIKNRQRNVELGLEAVIKNEPIKDSDDFLL